MIDWREFRYGYFFGDLFWVDCEVFVEYVFCVCVEYIFGGVDVMVFVILVGRGCYLVWGECECGFLWNDFEKNNDVVVILV